MATPAGGLEAPVAYFESFEALKNAPEGGLGGKIVYITGKMERTRDGAGYGPRTKNGEAGRPKRQNAALLLC